MINKYAIEEIMKKLTLILITLSLLLSLCMTGCQNNENNISESVIESDAVESESVSDIESVIARKEPNSSSDESSDNSENSALPSISQSYGVFDSFLSGESDCTRIDVTGENFGTFNVKDIYFDDDDIFSYRFDDMELKDLDNDGQDELIIMNANGGMYLDYDATQFTTLAESQGTAVMLNYVEYDGAIWIYYYDILHQGRKTYDFYKYNGAGNIVDSFDLKAEFYDSYEDAYDETSDFTYRGQKITMEEFDRLLTDIFGI